MNDDYDEDYTDLICEMILEVQELELEIVSLRYLLSSCMHNSYRESLRDDIFCGTLPEFDYRKDYQKFLKKHLNNKDPLNSRRFNNRMRRQAHGHIEENRHPLLYLEPLHDFVTIENDQILDKQ